jgi:magnesium transporter
MFPGNRYLKYIFPFIGTGRTRKILSINPTAPTAREDATDVKISVYDYDAATVESLELQQVDECFPYRDNNKISWINIDGLRKADVEAVCAHYNVHALIVEDILSFNQRPKMDELGDILYCLLYMMYYNEKTQEVEQEQISIILGKNFVLSFQEDASRDVLNPLRDKLKIAGSKIRNHAADYLCYTMLDLIVDNYYMVMEKLGDRIESLEEEVIRQGNTRTLARINALRKELIVLKRNIAPVRELINGFLRSENDLLDDRTTKYFKDVYDHIVQANDLSENYRDMMMNLQDLYLNNVNLKMNEVMKVMAIVTCLLAPATVIGGIFGMNFDRIPWLHHEYGFYIAVAIMLIIPIWMILTFRKRGWF